MRKTIKKARIMQTEINGILRSMKNSSLNFRKFALTNGTAFSEIYVYKGRFPLDQTNFRCEFPEISMGEWYRVFQCEKRQAGIFK